MPIVRFRFPLALATLASAGCIAGDFPSLPPLPAIDAGAPAGPSVRTWPPDGAFGVPPSPELFAIGLTEAERVDLTISVDGDPIAFETADEDCALVGFATGRCLVVELARPLPARGLLTVHHGGELASSMRLGDDARPPRLLSPDCATFEVARAGLCLDVDDRSARIHGALDRGARVELTFAGRRRVALAPDGAVDALFPLESGCPGTAALRMIGYDGRALEAEVPIVPERDLAPVHLVESLANPIGPEPDAEYVELANASEEPIDLGGFSLTDSRAAFGDPIPPGVTLPARGRLLLVAEGYERGAGPDVAPPPGTPLVRLDASLASGGLANDGEPLYLLDPRGRRVSAMPPVATPRDGTCVVARSVGDRRPNPERFAVGPCTPGR